MISLPVLVIVGFVVLFVLLAIFGSKQTKKRREALALLAQSMGWTFDPDDAAHLPQRFNHFATFSVGDTRRCYHTMTGALDVAGRRYAITAGDYRYTTETNTGKNRTRTTHHLSYMIFEPDFPLPARLTFRREGLFDKIAGGLGFDDIDFESAEFSRKFHVKSDDRKFAYDLFDPRMIEWLLSQTDPWPIQLAGGQFLFVGGGRWSPEKFGTAHAWAKDFFTRWPGHLLDRLTRTPPPVPGGIA